MGKEKTITQEEVIRIIQEQIKSSLRISFDSEYAGGDKTSKYTVKVYFKDQLISSDYQIITEG